VAYYSEKHCNKDTHYSRPATGAEGKQGRPTPVQTKVLRKCGKRARLCGPCKRACLPKRCTCTYSATPLQHALNLIHPWQAVPGSGV
jgi:hypothetical protein